MVWRHQCVDRRVNVTVPWRINLSGVVQLDQAKALRQLPQYQMLQSKPWCWRRWFRILTKSPLILQVDGTRRSTGCLRLRRNMWPLPRVSRIRWSLPPRRRFGRIILTYFLHISTLLSFILQSLVASRRNISFWAGPPETEITDKGKRNVRQIPQKAYRDWSGLSNIRARATVQGWVIDSC